MENQWLRYAAIAVAVGALVALLIFLLLLLNDDGGDDAAGTTTTSAVDTTTTSSGDTTTTTEGDTTTTSVGDTTTTTGATTTTTETTTTTIDVPPLILADDGIGGVSFGASPEDTVAYATAVLGDPDLDTGWIDGPTSPYGVCPEPEVRGVEWGESDSGFGSALTLLFTNAATTHGSGEHFFGYYYFGGTPVLGTAEGITVGSTNAELQSAIASAVIIEDPFDPSSGAWASDVDPGDQNLLWGFTTSQAPTGTLSSVNGGSTCGE